MKRIFVVVSMFSVMTVSAQSVSTKTSLVKGQQIEQTSKVIANITQEMMGQSMEIKMETNSNGLVEVKDVSADGYTVANTVKRVVMNMSAMGNEQNFDSDKKEDLDGPIGQTVKDKIGVSREYKLNKDGVITGLPVTEKKEGDNSMMGGVMSGAMEDELLGNTYSALIAIPAAGVKVGDTWNDSTITKENKVRNTYTLKQVNGTDAVVDVKGTLVVDREMEQQGMAMQMAMNGTITGELTFDTKSGVIKSRKQNTKATGSIEVAGQSVPLTLDTTAETTAVIK
ncbi:MAG: DUF6263 family protein [Flavitalea sp.]